MRNESQILGHGTPIATPPPPKRAFTVDPSSIERQVQDLKELIRIQSEQIEHLAASVGLIRITVTQLMACFPTPDTNYAEVTR